jgi:N-acetylneuraminate synthase
LDILPRQLKAKIEFLSTPFDNDSVDLLVNRLNVNRIKISSGDVTNAPLLLKIAQSDKPVILSTGMCSLADIEPVILEITGFARSVSRPPARRSSLSTGR